MDRLDELGAPEFVRTRLAHQTSQASAGCMGVPSEHENAAQNAGLLASEPLARNCRGEWTSRLANFQDEFDCRSVLGERLPGPHRKYGWRPRQLKQMTYRLQ